MSIPVDRLADELAKTLKAYTKEVEAGIEAVIDETAKECAAELKATSPKRTGKYAKGWGVTKQGTARIVWNKKFFRLVHLLEKGHAKRGGGRVAGTPHVAPAETKYVEKLEKRVVEVVEKGG